MRLDVCPVGIAAGVRDVSESSLALFFSPGNRAAAKHRKKKTKKSKDSTLLKYKLHFFFSISRAPGVRLKEHQGFTTILPKITLVWDDCVEWQSLPAAELKRGSYEPSGNKANVN